MPAFQVALQFIEWLTKSWAFLGSVAFALSALYLFEFKTVYAMPVAIVSAPVLAAWPMLFCFVFLGTTALSVCLVSPSAVMWVGMDRQGRRLIDGHRSAKGRRRYNPFGGADLGRSWLAAQFIGVGALLIAMSIYDELPTYARWTAWALGIGGVAAAIFALQGVRRRAKITGLGAWLVGGVALYCLFIQCICATVVFKFAFSLGQHNPTMTDTARWAAGVACSMAVVGAQYFVATRVKHGLRLEVLQQAVFICLAMTAIPLISPPFAARLPAKLLQERDFHGGTCVRLISSSEAVVKDWEGIAGDGPKLASRDLVYVAQMDGYQAKVTLEGPTTTIPVKQVRRVESCLPNDQDTKARQGK
ncbi:hypothetical protein BJI69_17995 [Luteibacter rhizovicinus DSM 16549]|uniref:Uncharacterized protein n=1 Tax=Luteibacter rhizovicinus DSM 16549 TaxID=1440763 RepID=A0A0G9HB12_9GAMM|nr:hypothetical protein BJI69_17995 [Luteibacter rhizovicinus DSM 16549]KLD67005.1 hypothetical protein Y883_10580 [Luteibacter rhizovicinus DSM 16549]KLD79582.1 hypothetical protein Y886_03750 [Xanthomonas hyacinthi DSM 19077]